MSKGSLFALALVSLAAVAGAQEPAPRADASAEPALSQISPSSSPELWLYTHEQRRYDDPKQAVRRKAEFRAEQRSQRIATLKWFGFSNQRPQAAATPFMDEYSPSWTGNGWHPYQWHGVAGGPAVIEYYGR